PAALVRATGALTLALLHRAAALVGDLGDGSWFLEPARAGALVTGGRGVESVDRAGARTALHGGEGVGRAGGDNYCTHRAGSLRTGGPALRLLRRVGVGALARRAGLGRGRVTPLRGQ